MEVTVLLLFFLCHVSQCSKISTYFLNSDYSYHSPLCTECPNMDCLYTEINNSKPPPEQITLCYRTKSFLYLHPLSPWSTILGFGTLNSNLTTFQEAILFAIYESGPWLGVKDRDQDSLKWEALGDTLKRDLHVWIHFCLSIDFNTRVVKLAENGVVKFEKQSDKVHNVWNNVNTLSVGCFARGCCESINRYMSMYGKVTDVQLFSRVLTDLEMEEYTGCRSRLSGDVVSWDSGSWLTSGFNNSIRLESLDWETEICKSQRHSYHMIPQPLQFMPNSLEACNRFSAEVVAHRDDDELEEITEYLSSKQVTKSVNCLSRGGQEQQTEVNTWLAITDNDKEGVWTNYYTKEKMYKLPWAENQPYQDAFSYNCVQLQVKFENNNGERPIADLQNDKCIVTEKCPTCRILQPTLKIHVRGLCQSSMFDRKYIYTTQNDGEVMYLGEQSSVITYDKNSHRWILRDSKNNESIATSNSSYDSLMMGKQFVDFSKVTDDKCLDGLIRDLKLSTCTLSQFTCNNGFCINISSRCDQTVDCDDNSDEENCKIIDVARGYNKYIPPFSYKTTNNR